MEESARVGSHHFQRLHDLVKIFAMGQEICTQKCHPLTLVFLPMFLKPPNLGAPIEITGRSQLDPWRREKLFEAFQIRLQRTTLSSLRQKTSCTPEICPLQERPNPRHVWLGHIVSRYFGSLAHVPVPSDPSPRSRDMIPQVRSGEPAL